MIYNLLETYEPYVPPTWAGGTDEEIVKALEKHYAGKIDLTEYWHVGDERQVSLSAMAATGVGESHVAQTATLVLVNAGGKTLQTPINGHTECAFVWQLKNLLNNNSSGEYGYMNSSYDSTGGWNSCARRTWCNNVFFKVMPQYMQDITKYVENNATGGNSSSSIITSYDRIALPCYAEVGLSATTSPYSDEGTQWAYYTDNASRIKYQGSSTTNTYDWWLRTAYKRGYDGIFCRVYPNGTGDYGRANLASGLAPFGCI